MALWHEIGCTPTWGSPSKVIGEVDARFQYLPHTHLVNRQRPIRPTRQRTAPPASRLSHLHIDPHINRPLKSPLRLHRLSRHYRFSTSSVPRLHTSRPQCMMPAQCGRLMVTQTANSSGEAVHIHLPRRTLGGWLTWAQLCLSRM